MLKGTDLGGYMIQGSAQKTMLIIFVVYTIAVIGLGLYVKNSDKNGGKMADYITGGGKLNSVEIAMIFACSAMAGGAMIGSAGLGYNSGYIFGVCLFTVFIGTYTIMGTIGKKYAIMKRRIHANTISQMLYHRYQSKTVTLILILVAVGVMMSASSAQVITAAKIFQAMTGGGYTMGLIVTILAVGLYSMTGGIKSLAKVCVIQGAVMLIAVIAIAFSQHAALVQEFGSRTAAMEMVNRSNAAFLSAYQWTPLYSLGVCIVNGWAVMGYPTNLQTAMYYDNQKTLNRAVIIGCSVYVIIQGIIPGSGVITKILNPDLMNSDWATVYNAAALLPSWMGGVVFCGIFAAIQSTVASYLVYSAASLSMDAYKTIIKPDANDKQINNVRLGVFAALVLINIIVSLNPPSVVMFMIMYGTGLMGGCYILPAVGGVFYKKATAGGALASAVVGSAAYIIASMMSKYDWYKIGLGNIHPMLISIIGSAVAFFAVSAVTKKIPLGVYKVWFCKDYDERFVNVYNASDLEELKRNAE